MLIGKAPETTAEMCKSELFLQLVVITEAIVQLQESTFDGTCDGVPKPT